MNAILIVTLGIAGLCCGWFFYSRYIARFIFKLDPRFITPAHALNDGVDYLPTNKYVLWGHHFTSVAGAAPIVGPAIAAYWGWLPAVMWIVFGTIFFAGMHDMGALWASCRHRGQSIGALSAHVIGPRTRMLYMIVVFLMLLMVNAVFAAIIAKAFVSTPGAVIPAWAAIVVALVIGQLLHRHVVSIGLLAVVGVAILYGTVYIGTTLPVTLSTASIGLSPTASWILILFLYAAIASILPVWVLLQPRDFINGIQLFVGLLLLYGAVFLFAPTVTAPAINMETARDAPSIVPLLFVTIACGAISGFHGIVSSGTTSKQLDKETDARFVGYLGAVGEGSLALITTVIVTGAALAVTPEEWHRLYSHFGAGGMEAFIRGGAELLNSGWGMSVGFAQALLATMLVLFAGTTMDSSVRLQRYIVQEWGAIYRIPWLQKGFIATIVAVGLCLAIAFGAGGPSGEGGMILWPLFGATNQLLAAMTLLVLAVLLLKMQRPIKMVLIPMVFVLLMSFFAAVVIFIEFWQQRNYLLMVIDGLVLIAAVWIILGAIAVVVERRQ